MSSLTLASVNKTYGAVEVLRDVDLHVEDGEFVVLVGPSGCGKSTLLRMIAGQKQNGVPPQRRDIAMVFQSYALFPHLTVAKNISFGLDLRRVGKQVVDDKVRAAAETLDLDKYLDRYPRQLSGGQRQRVAMARAIVREPRLYLMDEPLSNLDAQLRVNMRAEMKALHRRLGKTIVYVTHDQVEAMTLADKLVIMRNGRIEQTGNPLDLFDRPVNLFVAGFLGTPAMNLLPAELQNGKISVSGLTVAGLPPPRETFTLGLRPEDCSVGDGGVSAELRLIEQMGAESVLHLSLGGHPIRIVTRDRMSAVLGEHIPIRLDLTKAHFFNPSTGDAISDPTSIT